MAKRGLYYKLVESQEQSPLPDDGDSLPVRNDDDIQGESSSLSETLSQDCSTSNENEYQEVDKCSISSDSSTWKKLKGKSDEISIRKIMRMNKPEWLYITLGVTGSVIQGLSTPIYAYVFGEIMGLLDQSLDEDVQQLNNTLALVSLMTEL